MNDSRSRSSPPQIEHEAAAWVVKHERALTDAEQDEFTEWLAANPAHGRAFAWQRHNWRLLDQLAEWRPEHGPRPNRDLLAPTRARHRWRRPVSLALAAAAVIALSWHFRPLPREEGIPIAQIERRILADGSVIDMNRGAAITVNYSRTFRHVTLLRGEAHFTVVKNPAWPFVVNARGIDVQAVGTAFNVSIENAEVKVLVTEGRVRVEPTQQAPGSRVSAGEPAPLVEAGKIAIVSLDPARKPVQVETVSATEMERLLAWQPRMLEFTGALLTDVVAAFNRHNDVQVSVADPRLESVHLNVSFRSDNVDGFIRLMEAAFGIKAERTADGILLRSAKP